MNWTIAIYDYGQHSYLIHDLNAFGPDFIIFPMHVEFLLIDTWTISLICITSRMLVRTEFEAFLCYFLHILCLYLL